MYKILIPGAMLSGLRIRRHAVYHALPTYRLRVGRFRTGLGNLDLLSVEIDHPHHASTLGMAYCSVVVGILNYMMFQGN